MTDLQLVVLAASIMKSSKTGTTGRAADLIDDAQGLLLEAYGREIAHREHGLNPSDGCFICQMNLLLAKAQKNGPRIVPS